jgi:hypothetical protein
MVMCMNKLHSFENKIIPYNGNSANRRDRFSEYLKQFNYKLLKYLSKRKRHLLAFIALVLFSTYLGSIFASYLGLPKITTCYHYRTQFYIITLVLTLSAFTVYGKFISIISVIAFSLFSGGLLYTSYLQTGIIDIASSVSNVVFVFAFELAGVYLSSEVYFTSCLYTKGKCRSKHILFTRITTISIIAIIFNIISRLLLNNI